MKKFLLSLLALVALTAFADESVSFYAADNIEMTAGKNNILALKMKNSVDVTAFSFHIVLPEGITFEQRLNDDDEMEAVVDLTTRKKSDHIVSIMPTITGNTQISSLSMTNKPYRDSDGDLVTMELKIPSTMLPGEYEIAIKNISFSEVGNISHLQDNFTFKVTVSEETAVKGVGANGNKSSVIKVMQPTGIAIITENHDYGVEGVVK